MAIEHPYLLFLGDAADQLAAKTAQGVLQWRPDWCLGQLRLPGCQADLGLPDLSLEEAAAQGAKTLVVGVANRGGVISEGWTDVLEKAIETGFDLAAGLHSRLAFLFGLVENEREGFIQTSGKRLRISPDGDVLGHEDVV